MTAQPPFVDEKLCTGCRACLAGCPNQALDDRSGKGLWELWFRPERCLFCGRCAEICPEDAISYSLEGLSPTVEIGPRRLVGLPALTCSDCGKVFAAESGRRKINLRLSQPDRSADSPRLDLCPRCRASVSAGVRGRIARGEAER